MREVAPTHVSVVALPGQSVSPRHQIPVSAHILAGWPSAQKSPDRLLLHEASLAPVQVVLAVTTPCLHEPHGVPDEVTHTSLFSRPEPSSVEM